MSRPDTWMPLYIADYLADTRRLSLAAHGAYLLLIMEYWHSGTPLPDDDEELATILGVSVDEWQKVAPKVRPYFNAADGVLTHKRVDDEMCKARKRYGAKADALGRAREAKAAKAAASADGDVSVHSSLYSPVHRPVQRPLYSSTTHNSQLTVSNNLENCVSSEPFTAPLRGADDPDPEPKSEPPHGKPRGSRIAPDWQPDDTGRKFAVDAGFHPDEIGRLADEFRDYWVAVPGAKGLKLDWAATWRNRVREVAKRRTTARPGPARQERRGVVEIAAELAASYANAPVPR